MQKVNPSNQRPPVPTGLRVRNDAETAPGAAAQPTDKAGKANGAWGISGAAAPVAKANVEMVLANADFKQGLQGWSSFQTPNGAVLGLGVVPFEVRAGAKTQAVALAVGQQTVHAGPDGLMIPTPEGGGISQELTLVSKGRLSLSADVASAFESTGNHWRNGDGGSFELLVDDAVVARFEVAAIENHHTERGSLAATVEVDAGKHTVALRVSRGSRPSFAKETDAEGKVTKSVTLMSYTSGIKAQFEPSRAKP